MTQEAALNDKLITGNQTLGSLDNMVTDMVLEQKRHNNKKWFMTFLAGFTLLNLLMVGIGWLVFQGIGIWGNNIPAAWGFDIINFVWWIGIGHAGTLISAILLLLKQGWRNSINRFSEAMTIFAVMCAGIYPALHTGRPWNDYWLFPLPNILGLWPQFRSPLMWDVFAVSTYFTVSLVFWLLGLIPDFATLRDRSKHKIVKRIFGLVAMGWRGSAKHWDRYNQAYLILAGLSTPLVLSVHTIVSYDFAVSIVPGWNVTVFPPYFVAGAVFAGFAMVILLAIPVRKWYGLQDLITNRHMDWMAKILLATGLIVFYGYMLEVAYALYSGEYSEMTLLNWRLFGPYKYCYYSLLFCNGLWPQIMWIPKMRRSDISLFVTAIIVSIGMWLERFVIIPMSLTKNYLPSSDKMYYPRLFDYVVFAGSIGLFITLMFLFVRFLPVINIFEVKEQLDHMKHEEHDHAPELAEALA